MASLPASDDLKKMRESFMATYFADAFPGVFSDEHMLFFYRQGIEHPPVDSLDPQWKVPHRVHNWRNYASEALEHIWQTFTPKQKIVLADAMQSKADAEDWDRN